MKFYAILCLIMVSCLACVGQITSRMPIPLEVVIKTSLKVDDLVPLIESADLGNVGARLALFSGIRKIHLVDCGVVNAFYNPGTNSVVICNEFAAAALLLKGPEAVGPTLRWVLLHELTHAVVAKVPVVIPVYEESAADQLAVLELIRQGRSSDVPVMVWWMEALSAEGEVDDPSDSHLSPARRMQDALCLFAGSSPDRLGPALDAGLELMRVFECHIEYRNAVNFWSLRGVYPRPR